MYKTRPINFSSGPCKLPLEILKHAQHELCNYDQNGLSVMELSHRSSIFTNIINKAEKNLRALLSIPDNYAVLFMQGGGTGQFAALPLNLIQNLNQDVVDYIVTGNWSLKAAEEAEKYAKVNLVIPKNTNFSQIPDPSEWKLSKDAKYLYYCDNETIHGIEFPQIPKTFPNVPIICDMSSNFLTRKVDVSKFGAIFAGTQKNAGIAGLTIVIIRKDLIGNELSICPTILNFSIFNAHNSLYHTPPCFAIYMSGLYFEWILKEGGIAEMERRCQIKSKKLYQIIDKSEGFYCSFVSPAFRSRVNIPFRICEKNNSHELENKFLEEAAQKNMIQLKGHRLVGGIRASLFNAMSLEETDYLANFMIEFENKNKV